MAKTIRGVVEQDSSKHTIEHIHGKLKGVHGSRRTFIVVEGSDDLEFYLRFFDKRKTAMYYTTKLDKDGQVVDGGCEDLIHIVGQILYERKTMRVIGIIDTDYRRYRKGYTYPNHIFHTDRRDMEMTTLSVPRVQTALTAWNNHYPMVFSSVLPVLLFTGKLRILNDIYGLGCPIKKKVKISRVFDFQHLCVYGDWKRRYTSRFVKMCFHRRKPISQLVSTPFRLLGALWAMLNAKEKFMDPYDVCQGHDTLFLLSYCFVKNEYSVEKIWKEAAKAYTLDDFAHSQMAQAIARWGNEHGLALIKQVAV